MRIAHIINQFSHTSIPVEMADNMALTEYVDIYSLYDSQEKAAEMGRAYASHCAHIVGCGFKKEKRTAITNLTEKLLSGHYDIVNTHQTLSASIVARKVYNKANTRVVTTIHGSRHSYNLKQNLIALTILRNADGIVYNSVNTRNSLLSFQKLLLRKGTKHKVVYNGVDLCRIQNSSPSYGENFCKFHSIPDNAFLIVQIGRLEPVKNPVASIKGFESYLNSHQDDKLSYLAIVGSGSQADELANYVDNNSVLKGRVVFTGALERENVYSLMKRVDLQIIPSLNEGFCNALFETLSIGNQVIVSDIPVFRELLDNVGIYRFNPSNIIELADAIAKAIARKPDAENRRIFKETAQRYNIDNCISNYLKFYQSLH